MQQHKNIMSLQHKLSQDMENQRYLQGKGVTSVLSLLVAKTIVRQEEDVMASFREVVREQLEERSRKTANSPEMLEIAEVGEQKDLIDNQEVEEKLEETYNKAAATPWRLRPTTAHESGPALRNALPRPYTCPAAIEGEGPVRRPFTRGKSGNEAELVKQVQAEAGKFRRMYHEKCAEVTLLQRKKEALQKELDERQTT